jgi:hypothetical protein
MTKIPETTRASYSWKTRARNAILELPIVSLRIKAKKDRDVRLSIVVISETLESLPEGIVPNNFSE